jgi:hypothetical protein
MVPAVKPEDMSPDPKVVRFIIDLYMKSHSFPKAQAHIVLIISLHGVLFWQSMYQHLCMLTCVKVMLISGHSCSQNVQALWSITPHDFTHPVFAQRSMQHGRCQNLCQQQAMIHSFTAEVNSSHQYHVLQVQDYVNDKLNFIGPVRARTGNEILKGFRSLEHRQAQLQLPILAVHGTSDRCTSLPVHPLPQNLHHFSAQWHHNFVNTGLMVLTNRLCIAIDLFQSHSPRVILYQSLTYMTHFHPFSICPCSRCCSYRLRGLCARATNVSRALFMHSSFYEVVPHGTQRQAWITQRQHC